MLMQSMKPKKKKAKKAVAASGDAEAATPTAASEGDAAAPTTEAATATTEVAEAEPEEKDVWSTPGKEYTYTDLLDRAFSLLRARNPDFAVRKKQTLPTPDIVKVGTRKTMWSNFEQTTKILQRAPEHVMEFVLAESATEGSLDANKRLILKGRFVNKHFETLLKKYILEYVTCHMCKTPNTELVRNSTTRLYFISCKTCNSERSVLPIKTGFHATNRSDRRKVKMAAV